MSNFQDDKKQPIDLLDQFAMAAMQGDWSAPSDAAVIMLADTPEEAAKRYYDMAETMLAERSRRLSSENDSKKITMRCKMTTYLQDVIDDIGHEPYHPGEFRRVAHALYQDDPASFHSILFSHPAYETNFALVTMGEGGLFAYWVIQTICADDLMCQRIGDAVKAIDRRK